MYEWPKFAAHLDGRRAAQDRVGALLADLGEPMPVPSARDVLLTVFQDGALVDSLQRLAPRVHHVGLIAPPDLDVPAVAGLLRCSPFRHQLRRFRSTVLAKDLSSRLGRDVDVMVVQGTMTAPETRCPSVEIFVADLAKREIENLVVEEAGCHVALALAPDGSLDRVLETLHEHGCWEIPLMREGPLKNYEIHSSVLYVDVPGPERTRRLEFIACDPD
jgi:hypothetical protein